MCSLTSCTAGPSSHPGKPNPVERLIQQFKVEQGQSVLGSSHLLHDNHVMCRPIFEDAAALLSTEVKPCKY